MDFFLERESKTRGESWVRVDTMGIFHCAERNRFDDGSSRLWACGAPFAFKIDIVPV